VERRAVVERIAVAAERNYGAARRSCGATAEQRRRGSDLEVARAQELEWRKVKISAGGRRKCPMPLSAYL
jgi:hypothetical protein